MDIAAFSPVDSASYHLRAFLYEHNVALHATDAAHAAHAAPVTAAMTATAPAPASSGAATALAGLKADIAMIKAAANPDKALIAAKAAELEQLKATLPESEGGFTAAERASYEKKLAKLARSEQFAANSANKTKEPAIKKQEEPEPEPQRFTGAKKACAKELERAYYPKVVEAVWDEWWEAKGFYSCDPAACAAAKEDERFIMVIPPPNVTGTLHIGHALTCSIEDMLARWHRMLGHHVMWLPGTDHAGIATQSVVERLMLKEWEADKSKPKTRHELGREAFLERVWAWKNDKGSAILGQIRRLGASVDHSRTVFTMDETRSRAVTEAFCRLFDEGKIYRSTRLVHWSYALKTAISTIEVDDLEITPATAHRKVPGHTLPSYQFGLFHEFAYKVHPDSLKPGCPEEIVVATTRLETMLGDCAVVVNPDDERYRALHNARLVHPYHPERDMRVLCDELARMDLGTGAVKITPAHDEKDYAAALRLGMPQSGFISIFDDDGCITASAAGSLTAIAGMARYDARLALRKDLEAKGLFRGEKPNMGQVLPICSRSGDVVEPRLVPQWWVRMDEMADAAMRAVDSGELMLVPDSYNAIWKNWLEQKQPWCISRQLWWGHRIPAWRVKDQRGGGEPDQWFVARDAAAARAKATAALGRDDVELVQDDDVLDTWFSSGLFPFASFGWPDEQNADFKAFFPGTLLETGNDILFFWVARMVMLSWALCGKLPFKTVYLHAMVRDKDGRKMSKTLGNVIDPVEVIEGRTLDYLVSKLKDGNLAASEVKTAEKGMRENFKDGLPECGTDALRFGLLAYTAQARDINLDVHRVLAHRQFCNKLWQIARFCAGLAEKRPGFVSRGDAFTPRSLRDRWILSRLANCVAECDAGMRAFQFSKVTTALYNFWLYELADVYVEAVKPLFRDAVDAVAAQDDALDTLYACLDGGLRLLHPAMPYVTEELWQRLSGHPANRAESIMVARYPSPQWAARFVDAQADAAFAQVNELVRLLRNASTPAKPQRVELVTSDAALEQLVDDVRTLSKIADVAFVLGQASGKQSSLLVVSPVLALAIFAEKANRDADAARLTKKTAELQTLIDDLAVRLVSADYVAKAKAEVKAADQAKLDKFRTMLAGVQGELARVQE